MRTSGNVPSPPVGAMAGLEVKVSFPWKVCGAEAMGMVRLLAGASPADRAQAATSQAAWSLTLP